MCPNLSGAATEGKAGNAAALPGFFKVERAGASSMADLPAQNLPWWP